MRTIKGYIRDDSHQPLAEASIRLEESQLGTISNKMENLYSGFRLEINPA